MFFEEQLKRVSNKFLRGGGKLTFHLGKDETNWDCRKNIGYSFLTCWNLFVGEQLNHFRDFWFKRCDCKNNEQVNVPYCSHFNVTSHKYCEKKIT